MSAMDSTAPSPQEARDLFVKADSLGSSATAAASWPHIAFLLTFGVSTSMGTLAMGLTTGQPYFVAMFAMLIWNIVLVSFMAFFASSSKKGFKKRRGLYIGLWTAAYTVAILFSTLSQGTNIVGVCLSSGLLAAVTALCAWREARS